MKISLRKVDNCRAVMSLPLLMIVVLSLSSSSDFGCHAFQHRSTPSHLSPLRLTYTRPQQIQYHLPRQLTRKQLLSTNNNNVRHNKKTQLHAMSDPMSTSTTLATALTSIIATPLIAIASSPIGSIIVLAFIILIHECGHYFAARYFDISVEEFSIGFGPRIAGFNKWGNDFSIRAFPLGGYVKFPENYDIEKVQKQQKQAQEAFQQRKLSEQWTMWQEILNIVTLGSWDEQRQRQKQKETQQLLLEEQQKKTQASHRWNNVFQFNNNRNKKNTKNTNSNDITSSSPSTSDDDYNNSENYEIEYYDDPNLLQNRPWIQRAIVLSMGVIFNLLLSFSLYFGSIVGPVGDGLPQPIFDNGVVVSAPPIQNGPSSGLLQKGDIITGINGIPLRISRSTSVLEAQKQVSDVIAAIQQTPDGQKIQFDVLRSEQNIIDINNNNKMESTTTTMTKSTGKVKTVSIQPRRTNANNKDKNLDASTTPPSIGVFLSPKLAKIEKLKTSNVFVAAVMAWQYLMDTFTQTLNGVLSLLGTFLMGTGPPPGQAVSGPIGLIKQGSNVVATKDWTAVLLFAAAISVNLGVINALPLPALDGGQLVFVLAEALTGRKIDQRIQEGITSVAVLFLLFVSVSAAIGDVGNILSGIL